VTVDVPSLMTSVYSNLIDQLPRIAGFSLNPSSQLSVLQALDCIGSDACVAALLAGRFAQAVELLDHAHGTIWAQALRQRSPQLKDIPEHLAVELQTLLRAIATPAAPVMAQSSGPAHSYFTAQDIRHEQTSCIQAILREVRAMPGLE
jgi:hypothetical protein